MDIAATTLTKKLQTNIPELIRTFNVPGLSLAFVRDAQLVGCTCFGYRSKDTKEVVTEDTVLAFRNLGTIWNAAQHVYLGWETQSKRI